jgi:hypothetical protein
MAAQLRPERGLDHAPGELGDQPARTADLVGLDALERLLQRVTRKQLVQALEHFGWQLLPARSGLRF